MADRSAEITDIFLAGARSVLHSISLPDVDRYWDTASVLEEQTVGVLVGHLARSGVAVVIDYLNGPEPTGPITFASATAYLAASAERLSIEDHQAIRRRSAETAALGPEGVRAVLTEKIEQLVPLLAGVDSDRPLSVARGAVMHLSAYLETRLVEQVVHLVDLADSLERADPAVPAASFDCVLRAGVDAGRLRFGDADMVRALFRHPVPPRLPVL